MYYYSAFLKILTALDLFYCDLSAFSRVDEMGQTRLTVEKPKRVSCICTQSPFIPIRLNEIQRTQLSLELTYLINIIHLCVASGLVTMTHKNSSEHPTNDLLDQFL